MNIWQLALQVLGIFEFGDAVVKVEVDLMFSDSLEDYGVVTGELHIGSHEAVRLSRSSTTGKTAFSTDGDSP